jgi:hypothetical protein
MKTFPGILGSIGPQLAAVVNVPLVAALIGGRQSLKSLLNLPTSTWAEGTTQTPPASSL